MRIETISPMLVRSLVAALPKVAPRFEAPLDAPPLPHANPAHGGTAAVTTPSVQMLIALGTTDPEVERRRRMARDAERGLDALDRLHRELSTGVASVDRLREIAEWSQTFETSDNPVLSNLLSEIDLRVRVELAKFDIEI